MIQVNAHDEDDNNDSPVNPRSNDPLPSSPPPSFRSRASSPSSRHVPSQDPLASQADQTLADTFDDGEGSDAEDGGDDRQRLMRGHPESPASNDNAAARSGQEDQRPTVVQRRLTELPVFTPLVAGARTAVGGARSTNDGVFANLAAKPERGDKGEEKPPVSLSLLHQHLGHTY